MTKAELAAIRQAMEGLRAQTDGFLRDLHAGTGALENLRARCDVPPPPRAASRIRLVGVPPWLKDLEG